MSSVNSRTAVGYLGEIYMWPNQDDINNKGRQALNDSGFKNVYLLLFLSFQIY